MFPFHNHSNLSQLVTLGFFLPWIIISLYSLGVMGLGILVVIAAVDFFIPQARQCVRQFTYIPFLSPCSLPGYDYDFTHQEPEAQNIVLGHIASHCLMCLTFMMAKVTCSLSLSKCPLYSIYAHHVL